MLTRDPFAKAASVVSELPYGALTPNMLAQAVMAITAHLPDNWIGLRAAMALRRLVIGSLDGDSPLDVTRWGLRLRLYPRRNGCEKGVLFTPQMYEATERTMLFADIDAAKAQGRPFVFVDVGANVGLFSLLVVSRAGMSANIVAIEPEPESLRRLYFNIACNNAPIKVEPVAVGETEGHVAIVLDTRDRGGTRTTAVTNDQEGIVLCRPLWAIVRKYNFDAIDALKIDIEGNEDSALIPFFQEAPRSSWPKLLIIEDTQHLWSVDLFKILISKGYRIAARSRLNVLLRLDRNA